MLEERKKKIWFKTKTYGWGWTPATWQGWAVVALYIIAVFLSSQRILRGEEAGIIGVKRFLFTIGILTLLLLYTCYTHGEKPGWHWGKKNNEKDR